MHYRIDIILLNVIFIVILHNFNYYYYCYYYLYRYYNIHYYNIVIIILHNYLATRIFVFKKVFNFLISSFPITKH